MPVIIAAFAPLLITTFAVRAISLRTDPASRRGTTAVNVSLAVALVVVAFTVTTLSVAFTVSNTPLTDDVVNIYRTVASGYRESRNIPEGDALRGAILIYFKPGCQDCSAIRDELLDTVVEADKPNVYFVNTKSPTGRALLEKYPVKEVPAGVYVAYAENNTESFREALFTTTAAGTKFRWEAVDFLLRCQAQRW